MKAGDAFLFPNEHGVFHLHIIVSEPEQSPAEVFLVSISSYENWKENVCVLQPNDHPFITHKSVVVYDIRLTTLAFLESCQKNGKLKMKPPVSAEVLTRIRQGYKLSRFQKDHVYQLLFRQGLID
ncbi:MAG: hypothetical protein LBQ50_14320 [Planctomycetaceae bacterium]|jgi:hypothetical protein|nr:hypothetical protein [Planctomycetaceae bacterium]